MNLSETEIRLRMIELRNLRKLHTAQNIRIEKLVTENKALKERVAVLETIVLTQEQTNTNLSLQIEELRTIVFGKKRKKKDDDLPPRPPLPRTPDSYQRPVPREDEITSVVHHPLKACAECTTPLTKTRVREFFEEDIPLPLKKTVVRHVVTQGYCASCASWKSGTPLPSATVVLGTNVKRFVTYLSVVNRQSYTQIQELLQDTYNLSLSQGEIAKILEQGSARLRPEYERLAVSIRGEPSVHLDETSWPMQKGCGMKTYAWAMVGGASDTAVYLLGKSRGKGNATDLLGESSAVVVSDDYGAYRNLVQEHQLCCAHILRKLRDLKDSSTLGGEAKAHALRAYHTFACIYADIETARASSDPKSQYVALLKRLATFSKPSPKDPKKLANIRTQVRDRTACYLTCLKYPGIASDNNAAERSLRHLVIKRKTSFGSFSEKTAETLAVLTSVLMSYRKRGTLGNWLVGAGV
jgi:transposase